MNDNPLQRRLVHMDLKRGLDERGRPEIMDAAVSLTRVENLIQEQDGSWVKRPGLQQIGGALPVSIRPIRTVGGLGVVGVAGVTTRWFDLYRLNEASGDMVATADDTSGTGLPMSEMSVEANFVAASQGLIATPSSGPRVMAVAGSTKYDAVIVETGTDPTGGADYNLTLVVSDIESGSQVARYPIQASSVESAPKLCFVGDRYLHMYHYNGSLYPVVYSIDTNSLPSTLPAATTIVASANRVHLDVCANDTHSFIVAADNAAASMVVYKVDTSGTVSGSVSLTTPSFAGVIASCYYHWNGTKVVVVYEDSATFRIRVSYVNPTSMVETTTFVDPSLTFSSIGSDCVGISVNNGGGICLVGQDEFTFSSGTTNVPFTKVAFTDSEADTSFSTPIRINSWRPASQPFHNRYTNKHYLHVNKWDSINTDQSMHCVVCLSDYREVDVSYGSGVESHVTMRCAAVLENANGYQYRAPTNPSQLSNGNPVAVRVLRRGSDASADAMARYALAVPYRQAASGMVAAVYDVKFTDKKGIGCSELSGSSYIRSGCLQQFDGFRVAEQGFVDQPFATAVDSGGGSGPDGLLNYCFVFRSVDAVGGVSYSRVYGPVSITVADNAVTLTVSAPHVTSRESGLDGDQQVTVEVYRTQSGGSVYYFVGEARPNGAGIGLYSLSDTSTDAIIASNRKLFRQPGTNNSPLDRYPAPGGKGIICQHKDRLFVADPYGQRVWYSSFSVDGETAWFSPGFTFFVNGGSGPITGMASMDGRLIIFKKNAVFVVDGDGPPEGGGNGSEFSPPNQLAVTYGCIDHRSIVMTPLGIMYRSSMGIELLSRSLERQWVGERVQNTSDDNPETLGSCIDHLGLVHFLLAATDDVSDSTQTVELVFDTTNGAWSKFPHDVRGLTGICTYDENGQEKVCLSATNGILYQDYDTSVDVNLGNGQTTTYPKFCLESAWIHVNGPAGRQRIHDFFFMARKASDANHALKVSVAYNYVDSYTQTATWEPGTINALDIEQLNLNPARQSVTAIRFKVEDQTPADTGTYPVGSAKGCAILSMAIDVAPKAGGLKLAPDSKG